MDAKILFISDWLRNLFNFSELCRKHGISRKTGYKWVTRYREDAECWFKERSRRPRTSPFVTPEILRREIIWLRERHKDWGAKKIAGWLRLRRADWKTPSESAIYKILKTEKLVVEGKKRRLVPKFHMPLAPVSRCNELWTADFKGQFVVGDGTMCYPLTVMEHTSRYLIDCVFLSGTRYEETQKAFERIFERYGLPDRIRTDNGPPFAAIAVGGLSRLSIWWLKLGIMPERIEPGHPEQNGQHERMHRTLKKATVEPPARNKIEQQKRFDEFRREYNEERPHESLEQMPPASRYTISERKLADAAKKIEYPVHYRLAFVNSNGCISHNRKYVYVGYLLRGETVGLEEIDLLTWEVSFCSIRLGHFKEDPFSAIGSCTKLQYV